MSLPEIRTGNTALDRSRRRRLPTEDSACSATAARALSGEFKCHFLDLTDSMFRCATRGSELVADCMHLQPFTEFAP